MKNIPQTIIYQETLSLWAGCKAGLYDDFDVFCDNDYDFLEILILFEKEFSLNLLDTTKIRQDFSRVLDFFCWISSRPVVERSSTFLYSHKPEVIPIF